MPNPSWLTRQLDSVEESLGGRVERYLQAPSREAAKSSDIASPTHAAWLRMIGATGAREVRPGEYEAMISGQWKRVDDPKTYFMKKSKEKWGGEMPEDKGKKKSEGPKNKKGGDMFAEDDFPIQGMNPSSAPLGGEMDLSTPPMSTEPSGSPPQSGEEALSGAKWAEPILQAIPGNRSDLMSKALKLIGQLGEILTEAGYTEGGGGGTTPGPVPPGADTGQSPKPPASPGM